MLNSLKIMVYNQRQLPLPLQTYIYQRSLYGKSIGFLNLKIEDLIFLNSNKRQPDDLETHLLVNDLLNLISGER